MKVAEIVTEKIIAAMEQGNIPWHKPWSGIGAPRNAKSNTPYHGINTVLLGMAGYSDPRWLTMKQVNELGGKVRKGEKASIIVFWKMIPKGKADATEGEDNKKVIPLLRYYNVFNVEQCSGISFIVNALSPLTAKPVEPLSKAEAIVANMPSPPAMAHDGGDRAYYRPSTDSVHLPLKAAFDSANEMYSTLFHELGHATGHTSRLGRKIDEPAPFGSPVYSREELVAEFCAAFLCAESGIDNTVENSAAYIKGWMSALKADPNLVITAASKGNKAADYIMGKGESAE